MSPRVAAPPVYFPPSSGLVHGTRPGYQRGKCRCDPCAEANAAYGREWKERTGRPVATSTVPPLPARHGSRALHNKGCSCDRCLDAARAARR